MRVLRNLFFSLTSNFLPLTSIFLATLYLLLATLSSAQTPEWVYQYVKPKTDIPSAITVDSFGNTYTTGYLTSLDTTGGHISGICVIKLNTFGQEQWIYFDDTLARLAHGDDIAFKFNKVYVAGYAQFLGGNKDLIVLCVDTLGHTEWIHRDTGALEANAVAVALSRMVYIAGFTYTPNTLLDIIVKKLDSLGNECWRYVYDGPAGSYDEAGSIAIDKDENIYVGGYSTGLGTAEDFTVLKLDSAGHLVWEYRYDGPAHDWDEPKAMALDTFGNIYIAGWSWGMTGGCEFCVVKIDSSGQEEWVYRYDGPVDLGDYLYDLAIDDTGNVYICGRSVRVDSVNVFTVIKIDSSGNEQWCYFDAGQWDKGGAANCLVLDGLGHIYAGGNIRNFYYLLQIGVVKLNSSGDLLWRYIYPHNPPSPWADVTHDMVVDVYGNVYLAGRICVNSWNDDIVVMKFASSQGKIKEVMRNEIREKSKNATIFKGGIEFLPEEDCGLKVYDVSGRVVVAKILQSGKRESIKLLSGVYFIVIEGENGKKVKKVVVL